MRYQDTLKQFFPKSERAKQGGETVVGVCCMREESVSKKKNQTIKKQKWKGKKKKKRVNRHHNFGLMKVNKENPIQLLSTLKCARNGEK